MSPVCKMADYGLLTVDQKVKVVLFYAETKSVVATQRRFHAHFGTRWAPGKQTVYGLSLGTIVQPMRINSVQDVKCFCNNKNVLCVHGMTFRASPCVLQDDTRSIQYQVNPHTFQNAWQSRLLIPSALLALFGLVRFEFFSHF